jgi:DNA-binding response OmpR family regulator
MSHVLIVDDDPLMCDMCTLSLTRNGYSTRIAHTNEEAITAIQSQQPDCILLDIHLGKTLGISILNAYPHLAKKTVVLTNDDNPETVATFVSAGISDYVVKSGIVFDTLIALVQKKIAL